MEPKQTQHPEWLWLVIEAKSNDIKCNIAWEPGMLGPWIKANWKWSNRRRQEWIELKWTGMSEFNSDDHYTYYCGQESLRNNGVAIIVNNRVWNEFSSVAQPCPTLCDPMNRSMSVLPVHHQLPEFTQTHVHWVSDAIQPSHPLLSTSPPAPSPSQHQGLSQWVNSLHEVAKVLEFQLQHQSYQWTPRTDLL